MTTEANVFLVLTSALAIKGEVVKAGTLVEVSNRDAVDFLRRGKARLATEKDGAPAVLPPEAESDAAPVDSEKADVKPAKKDKAAQ